MRAITYFNRSAETSLSLSQAPREIVTSVPTRRVALVHARTRVNITLYPLKKISYTRGVINMDAYIKVPSRCAPERTEHSTGEDG